VGWDHAKIGAYYLWNHHISDDIVDAVHWHHEPLRSESHQKLAGAIQVADFITSGMGVAGLVRQSSPIAKSHGELDGWKILFEDKSSQEMETIEHELNDTVERISQTLHGIL
jgi:predicted hydrolase (HD superfamily)